MSSSASLPVHGSALVTGASRGIGRAIALELAARGFDTVATMRDPDAGASLPEEADGFTRGAALGRDRPLDLRASGRPASLGQQRRHRRRLSPGRACQHGRLATDVRDQRVRGGRADRRGDPGPAGQRAVRGLHGQLVLDLRLGAVLFGLSGVEGCGLGVRRQPAHRGGALRHPGGRDPARAPSTRTCSA